MVDAARFQLSINRASSRLAFVVAAKRERVVSPLAFQKLTPNKVLKDVEYRRSVLHVYPLTFSILDVFRRIGPMRWTSTSKASLIATP